MQTSIFEMTVFGLGHSIFAKAFKKCKPSQKRQEKYFPKSGIGTNGRSYEMTISGAFWSSITCLRHKKVSTRTLIY